MTETYDHDEVQQAAQALSALADRLVKSDSSDEVASTMYAIADMHDGVAAALMSVLSAAWSGCVYRYSRSDDERRVRNLLADLEGEFNHAGDAISDEGFDPRLAADAG